MDELSRIQMEQMTKDKDNQIKNITEKYETTVSKLKTEVGDGGQQIQIIRAEKVNIIYYLL